MKRLAIIWLFVLPIASCTVTTKKGNVAVGGKGAARGDGWAVTWDNEKSFNDAAWVALAAIPAMQAVKTVQATEATARAVNKNATKLGVVQSNNAVKELEIVTEGANKAAEIAKKP